MAWSMRRSNVMQRPTTFGACERRTWEFRDERNRRRRRVSILFSEPGKVPVYVIGLTHDTPIAENER
jgi:hypothetical protein